MLRLTNAQQRAIQTLTEVSTSRANSGVVNGYFAASPRTKHSRLACRLRTARTEHHRMRRSSVEALR